MDKPKYYTDYHQQEKLVKLGIDPNTADFSFTNKIGRYTYSYIHEYFLPYSEAVYHKESSECIYPCWSVGALIDLLPNTISLKNGSCRRVIDVWDWQHRVCYMYPNSQECFFHCELGGNLFDCVYNMLIFLIENGYFSK